MHCETFVRSLGHLEGRNFDEERFIIGRSYGIALRSVGLATHWPEIATGLVAAFPCILL
jgi:hypothetical protein